MVFLESHDSVYEIKQRMKKKEGKKKKKRKEMLLFMYAPLSLYLELLPYVVDAAVVNLRHFSQMES